jgi:hypothetical protein
MGDIGRICREAASANEIDRPILAYRSLLAQSSKHENLSIPFLKDESWKKITSLDLCTSHCGICTLHDLRIAFPLFFFLFFL